MCFNCKYSNKYQLNIDTVYFNGYILNNNQISTVEIPRD